MSTFDFEKRVPIKEILTRTEIDTVLEIAGWLRSKRDSKGRSFLEINDGSCFKNLQVVAEHSSSEIEEILSKAHTGAALWISGKLVQSPAKGQRVELQSSEIKIVGHCSAEDYPLQKKGHSLEFLRENAHLRARTNTFGSVFRVRHAAAYAVHKFFNDRGFFYINTPIITASDCEGAGQMFRVTTLDVNKPPKLGDKTDSEVDYSKDFFGKEASLTVSGQLNAESLACALGDVYTFGPTFRAENSNTTRHLSEFWMIEPEMAFCDLNRNMHVAEDFTKYVINYVLENCADEMEFFEQRYEKGIIESLRKVVQAKYQRMTYTAAVSVLEKCGKKFEYPVSWGIDLQTEHEKFLTEEHVKGPVFVTNYPKEIKAFYMRLDADGKTVSAMDLLVPRLGEIIGGSQREEREDVLRMKIQAMGLPEKEYWWYLDIRKYGTVPHAGFGLGFERILMYLTGMTNIRDVIPFHRAPGSAEF